MVACQTYCEQKQIPHSRCGKLIVAVKESELPYLETLYARGCQNGVVGLQLVDADRIRQLEPFCKGAIRGLHVPSAGIVDYHKVVLVLFIHHFIINKIIIINY